MSFDVGGDFEENAVPEDVSSDINTDPQSTGYGDEQLTTDPANPGDTVGNESGNANFQDATNPGATQDAPTNPTSADPQATAPEQAGPPAPSSVDQAVSSAKDTVASAADKVENAVTGAGQKIESFAKSTLTNIENKISSISVGSIVNSAVTTVERAAVNTALGLVNRSLSAVVGPAAAATLTNGAVSVFNGPTTKTAGAVNPNSINPSSPQFIGPPAPSNTSVNPSADPNANQSDVAQLNADGSVNLSQFNTGPTQLPTNYTGEAANISGADANAVASTSATDVSANANPQAQAVTYTTDSSGNTYQVAADGTKTLYRAAEIDENTGLPVNAPAPGSTNVADTSAVPVADPNLAQVPANATANGVNPASINTSPGAISATAAGLTGSAIVGAAGQASIATAANAANAAVAQLANNAAALALSAQAQQTARLQFQNQAQSGDWRVKLCLAPNSNYLYNNQNDPGSILWPLYNTNGVIFPYTPAIDTAYKANYTPYDLTHSNYRGYFYQNSYVDSINLKATFTAQDTNEANYLLAVIHFFRSVTKMFYGQDYQAGSPPPLVFLSGLGDYQFNNHPCVVSQFNYSLPPDVNYIRAQNIANDGTNQLTARNRQTVLSNPLTNALQRLSSLGQGIQPGAVAAPFVPQGILPAGNPTYVPTKMDITVSLLPMQSRAEVSQLFSLAGFANGNLLKGGFW